MTTKTKPTPQQPAKSSQTKATRPTKTPKAPQPEQRMSILEGAARVLEESQTPLTTQAMIEAMAAQGYWSSPNGQTPAQTLYSAILRELQKKGSESRFQKVGRGQFALNTQK